MMLKLKDLAIHTLKLHCPIKFWKPSGTQTNTFLSLLTCLISYIVKGNLIANQSKLLELEPGVCERQPLAQTVKQSSSVVTSAWKRVTPPALKHKSRLSQSVLN